MAQVAGRIFFYTVVLLFLGTTIYTITQLSAVTGNKDNSEEFSKIIRLIAGVNGAVMILMTFIAYQYIKSDPLTGPSYIFLMIHISIFISIMAASIAVLSKNQL
jgi:hypothetical protein